MPEGQSKWEQSFFDEAPVIRLKDPLAYALGAMEPGGDFIFTYADSVKMAGHSCGAVSGAYMITYHALKALYGEETPVRGEVRVAVMGKPTDLAYGPMSQVISLITGAAGETGFKGLRGNFQRYNRLIFDMEHFEFNTFIFQRVDNGKTVAISYDNSSLPQDPAMGALMPKVIMGTAKKEERDAFVSAWQGNVRRVLCEGDKYGLFTIREASYQFPAGS